MTADPQQVTYHQVSTRFGARVWEAVDRRNQLDQRYHQARAEAALKARGEFDPAKYGPGNTQPLTTDEHLERIALDEYIVRHYQPHYELDEALKAGASLSQVADALGCREDQARERIRSWAEGQHDMRTGAGHWSGEPRPFGLDDEEYAAVMDRVAVREATQ